MRTVEVLQILGTLVGGLATLAVGLEQRLLRRLKARGATSPETAIALPRLRAISRWRLSRLLKHGVVRRNSDGLYFIHRHSHRMLRKRRLTRAIPAVLVALAAVVILHAILK